MISLLYSYPGYLICFFEFSLKSSVIVYSTVIISEYLNSFLNQLDPV